jgi:hypothetical protein
MFSAPCAVSKPHFFTTSSSSWLNLVERWFGKITTERIRRGVFTSVPELERAIYDYIERNNADPKPFVWTKSANAIILKVNRGRAALKMLPLARRALGSIVILCTRHYTSNLGLIISLFDSPARHGPRHTLAPLQPARTGYAFSTDGADGRLAHIAAKMTGGRCAHARNWNPDYRRHRCDLVLGHR